MCFSSDCGGASSWQFNEGGVNDNGFKFCPFCGRAIEELICETRQFGFWTDRLPGILAAAAARSRRLARHPTASVRQAQAHLREAAEYERELLRIRPTGVLQNPQQPAEAQADGTA